MVLLSLFMVTAIFESSMICEYDFLMLSEIEVDNEVASPTPINPNEVIILQIAVRHFFCLIDETVW